MTDSDLDISEREIEAGTKTHASKTEQVALAALTIATALKPRSKDERKKFDRRIRRAISRTRKDQSLLRTLLEQLIRT